MIQETVHRLAAVCSPSNLLVITGQQHAREVSLQLPELSSDQIIVESVPRGSGPAIGLAAVIIHRRNPHAIIGSFAADHIVTEPAVFEHTIRTAVAVASKGYLVTIGLQTSYPETGYGYIRSGSSIGHVNGLDIREVDAFKEKPDRTTAIEYVESGEYLWNASMFVCQVQTLMNELHEHLPGVADALERIASVWDTPERETAMQEIWPEIEDVTIDHGILEHSNRVAVVPGRFGWTDLGDWHGFGNMMSNIKVESNENQNDHGQWSGNYVVNAELLSLDSTNSIVFGHGRLIALLGLDNVAVIDTEDALLICNRTRAQDVRKVVEQLKQRGSSKLT